MKRLMICFVLLMALFVYAVPTESDVGAGYSVAIGESGDAIVLATQFETEGYLVQPFQSVQTYEWPDMLVNGLTPTAKYGVVTVSPLTSQRNYTMRTPTIILRC